MNGLPFAMNDYLPLVVRETARLSYPGAMGRGANHVLIAGAKHAVEEWFVRCFPIAAVWNNAEAIAEGYAGWHKKQTRGMAVQVIDQHMGNPANQSQTIAAKILDTFMHQLMKYGPCRALWKQLHLPLDNNVFKGLRHHHPEALHAVDGLFRLPPYSISYQQYRQVQAALWGFVDELNNRRGAEVQFHSRIELNWLWLDP